MALVNTMNDSVTRISYEIMRWEKLCFYPILTFVAQVTFL